MEIIIFVAVVVVATMLWNGYVKTKKNDSDHAIDHWEPPKELVSREKEWPYGEKLSEGNIHVKVADLAPTAPGKSADDRVEAPAPVVEQAPAKKVPAKKPAAKPAVAKKAPVKKKSV